MDVDVEKSAGTHDGFKSVISIPAYFWSAIDEEDYHNGAEEGNTRGLTQTASSISEASGSVERPANSSDSGSSIRSTITQTKKTRESTPSGDSTRSTSRISQMTSGSYHSSTEPNEGSNPPGSIRSETRNSEDSTVRDPTRDPTRERHRRGPLRGIDEAVKSRQSEQQHPPTSSAHQEAEVHHTTPSVTPDSPHSETYEGREPGVPATPGSSGMFNFIQRLREKYGKGVLFIWPNGGRIDVNLATFQRVQLETIQRRLLETVLDFQYLDWSSTDWDGDSSIASPNGLAMRLDEKIYASQQLMNDYVTACKNLDFMTETRKNHGYDPFVVRTDSFMRRESLRDAYQHWRRPVDRGLKTVDAAQNFTQFEQAMELLQSDQGLKDKDDPVHMGGGTRSMRIKDDGFQAYTEKVGMALVGGVFLIAPMLIMVLHPGLVTSLVTTSVCVFAFSLVMSLPVFLKAPFDVLSATAAYAAVLVVFIGTGGGGE